jgi:hypothetical protein
MRVATTGRAVQQQRAANPASTPPQTWNSKADLRLDPGALRPTLNGKRSPLPVSESRRLESAWSSELEHNCICEQYAVCCFEGSGSATCMLSFLLVQYIHPTPAKNAGQFPSPLSLSRHHLQRKPRALPIPAALSYKINPSRRAQGRSRRSENTPLVSIHPSVNHSLLRLIDDMGKKIPHKRLVRPMHLPSPVHQRPENQAIAVLCDRGLHRPTVPAC